MAQFSFDVVSEIDFQEVDNAVNQAVKELRNRYDFKGSKSTIEFSKSDKRIKLVGDDDLKLKNLQDILKTRVAARKLPVKSLKFKDPEKAFEGTLRQEIELINGIPQDRAKQIVKDIKQTKLKVQAAIQDEQIRITSKSKDDLQGVMAFLKENIDDIPLQFKNLR